MDSLLVCVLILCIVFKVETKYRIKELEEDSTWQAANDSCTLATPELLYSIDGLTANLRGVNIASGSSGWIGYVKAYQTFQYIGCVKKTRLGTPNHTVNLDPGLCHYVCNRTKYFGIGVNNTDHNKSYCYCFNNKLTDDIDLKKNKCDVSCTHQQGACGGNNHISLYEHVNILDNFTDNILDNDALCCQYIPNPPFGCFKWVNCTTLLNPLCEENSTSNATIGTIFETWQKSFIFCFKNELYPLTFKNRSFLQNESISSPPMWTGILGSRVVFSILEAPGERSDVGYLENVNGTYQVKFDEETGLKRKALCLETENDNSVTTTLAASSQENDNSITTTLAASIGVSVGVPVAVVVILAIAVVTFIMLKKRHHKALCQNGKKEIEGHSNTTYNTAKDVNYSPNLSENTVTLDESSAYDLIDSIPGERDEDDDAYNTTFTSGKCVVLKETDNVYNRLETETEDTYNHVNMNTSKLTTSSNKTTDNTHSPNHVIDAEADYSHINASSNNKNDTDNVYSKANFVKTGSAENHGDELDDTDTTSNMAGQNANRVVQSSAKGSTYSHLKSQSK